MAECRKRWNLPREAEPQARLQTDKQHPLRFFPGWIQRLFNGSPGARSRHRRGNQAPGDSIDHPQPKRSFTSQGPCSPFRTNATSKVYSMLKGHQAFVFSRRPAIVIYLSTCLSPRCWICSASQVTPVFTLHSLFSNGIEILSRSADSTNTFLRCVLGGHSFIGAANSGRQRR